jgi:hypothetical protein
MSRSLDAKPLSAISAQHMDTELMSQRQPPDAEPQPVQKAAVKFAST